MDTFFDYIVDAAYKIEQFTEDDLVGSTEIEGKFSSFTVIHDLKSATITNNRYADLNKDLFCKIFLEILNEKKRLLDIEYCEQRSDHFQEMCAIFQPVNHAGTMSGE